jgi:hypothetical protein
VPLLRSSCGIDLDSEGLQRICPKIQDPDVVRFLQARLFDQQLVDWIFEPPFDRLKALYGAFRSARELRSSRQ